MMKETVLLNCYEVDDIKYIVVNEIDFNNIHYVYLSNINDNQDIMVRRVNGDILEPLESEQEFIEVMKLIIK